MRAGGKHNDLDNVGFTKRHLTFFEMMGSFSFGDYFKEDAISFAWEFLTEVIGLEKEKLFVSVYYQDDESYRIWRDSMNVPEDKIVKLGDEDNFWQVGDTGPCGPCTEIHIDRGPYFECSEKGCAPGCSCERFLEIWNLVFMQFNRQPDGTMKELEKKGVDTGMGIERITSIVQNADSVYETDLFTPLIKKIEQITDISYNTAPKETKAAFRVLCDHIRSSSFAICDGAMPSNESRGYVLRKIIRRAALFAQKLTSRPLFPKLAVTLINHMGDIYPDLYTQQDIIITVLESEIEKFASNLEHGQKIVKEFIADNTSSQIITGPQAFKLYDTYGFPLELTQLIAQEHSFTVDIDGFEKKMEEQKRQSGKKQDLHDQCTLDPSVRSQFTGYTELETDSTITHLIVDNKPVEQVPASTDVWVITQKTPFYVECGGQVSDKGYIEYNGHQAHVSEVKNMHNAIAMRIEAPTDIHVNQEVKLVVDEKHRRDTMNNHTATHLLQSALRDVFGKTVKQSGSVVHPDYLRFDFTHHKTISTDDIKRVEDIVNKRIRQNIQLNVEQKTLKQAQDEGVIAFFGDKYNPDDVRVVRIADCSAELCGGTHVARTGDIGLFKITDAHALSAGNKRIVALTGHKAMHLFQETFTMSKTLSQTFKVTSQEVVPTALKQQAHIKSLEKEIRALKTRIYMTQIPQWLHNIQTVNGINFLYKKIDDATIAELKDIALSMSSQKEGLFIVVSGNEKISFFVSLSNSLKDKIDMNELSAHLKSLGLKGGVKKTTIQGGAPSTDKHLEHNIIKWLKSL
jgi:alanyl-tRNA synthetase